MDSHETFLRAIAQHPFDASVRATYAAWLDAQDDLGGEYLRMQPELNAADSRSPTYARLWEREQQLMRELDPVWLHRARRYTTAPPCRDIAQLAPEMLPYQQETIWLHPHRMVGERPAEESKFGGQFLWPKSEPWPNCPQCGAPLVAVLQLRSYDVPNRQFPHGTDVFQLLWCPPHDHQPTPHIYWRAAADVQDVAEMPIANPGDESELVPRPCSIYPERVIEYPGFLDLDYYEPDVRQRILTYVESIELPDMDGMEDRLRNHIPVETFYELYCGELSDCKGTKTGNRPPRVHEGQTYEHFLEIASWEFDGASYFRWIALEDQRMMVRPGETLSGETTRRAHEFQRTILEPTGMQLARTQKAHLWICRTTTPWSYLLWCCD